MLLISIIPVVIVAVSGHHDGPHYDQNMYMDQDGKYRFSWSTTNEYLLGKLEVETHGYIGFGISPTGGMVGSDILIAGVEGSGKGYLKDRFATGKSTPDEDEEQNVELVSAKENSTHTIVEFKRPLISCDTKQDIPIQKGLVRVIWSYHGEDPNTTFIWHGPSNRGTKNLHLIGEAAKKMTFDTDSNVKQFDAKLSGQYIPSNKQTLYWCKIIKYPDWTQKHHMIGYKPLVQRGNEERIQRIVVRECRVGLDTDPDTVYQKYTEGAECYGPNMPEDWNNCETTFASWTSGSEGESFPEEVGYPMGHQYGGPSYFMLEIHYDNSQFEEFFDSSGLRFFMTAEIRKYEAGVMNLGQIPGIRQFVPPKTKKFEWTSPCSTDCLDKNLSPDGIRAFQVLLRSHYEGRQLSLRHVRDGEELEPIAQDFDYDFNYQQARSINPPKEVRRGDTLITHCIYDTSNVNNITHGGLSTVNELCSAFVLYYPRETILKCMSTPSVDNLSTSLSVKLMELSNSTNRNIPDIIVESHNMSLKKYLESTKWDENRVTEVEKQLMKGSFINQCVSRKDVVYMNFSPPDFKKFVEKEPECVSLSGAFTIQPTAIAVMFTCILFSVL